MAVYTRYGMFLLWIHVSIIRAHRRKRTGLSHPEGVGAYSSSEFARAA